MMYQEMIGQTFNRLTVVSLNGTKNKKKYWNVQCACGVTREKPVETYDLRSGRVKSCGCLLEETRRNNGLKKRIYPEGHAHNKNSKSRSWYKTEKGIRSRRFFKLKKRYGLEDDVISLILDGDPVCEICSSNDNICVDHDHKTGRFRGLLCKSCNFALGILNENPDVTRNLLRYIEKNISGTVTSCGCQQGKDEKGSL